MIRNIPWSLSLVMLVLLGCTAREPKPLVPQADYTAWTRTTEVELDYPVPGHESHYRRIYINDQGKDPLISREGSQVNYQYPEGTVVVKEIYPGQSFSPGDEPVALTIMVKAPDHAAARQGWVYLLKNPDSGAERIFEGDLCFTCHKTANESHPYGDGNQENSFRDYLFFPFPPEGAETSSP